MTTVIACPSCRGTGRDCTACQGTGVNLSVHPQEAPAAKPADSLTALFDPEDAAALNKLAAVLRERFGWKP